MPLLDEIFESRIDFGFGHGDILISDDSDRTPERKHLAGTPHDHDQSVHGRKGRVGSGTDSPEFKSWFGDSKVVDGKGKPMVVYHGSPSKNLDKFDDAERSEGFLLFGPGFYFAESKDFATPYTGFGYDYDTDASGFQLRGLAGDIKAKMKARRKNLKKEGYPTGLVDSDIAMMRRIQFLGARESDLEAMAIFAKSYGLKQTLVTSTPAGKVYSVYLAIERPFDADNGTIDVDGKSYKYRELIHKEGWSKDRIRSHLVDLGHDGITGFEMEGTHFAGSSQVWVAFEPEQIKAVDNNGNFDPESPYIRKSYLYGDRKHRPGGKDHNQKDHGRKGSATSSRNPVEMTKDEYRNYVESLEPLPWDTFTANGVRVVRNPTSEDYQQNKREAREQMPGLRPGTPTSRFTLDKLGNRYIWPAHAGVHFQVEPGIERREGNPVNQNFGIPTHRQVIKEAMFDNLEKVPQKVIDSDPKYAEYLEYLNDEQAAAQGIGASDRKSLLFGDRKHGNHNQEDHGRRRTAKQWADWTDESKVDAVQWSTKDNRSVSKFTVDGEQFEAVHQPVNENLGWHRFDFNHVTEGDEITGRGKGYAVIKQAAIRAASAIKETDPTMMMFQARADQPSRVDLYRFMASRAQKLFPDYTGVELKTPGERRRFAIVKTIRLAGFEADMSKLDYEVERLDVNDRKSLSGWWSGAWDRLFTDVTDWQQDNDSERKSWRKRSYQGHIEATIEERQNACQAWKQGDGFKTIRHAQEKLFLLGVESDAAEAELMRAWDAFLSDQPRYVGPAYRYIQADSNPFEVGQVIENKTDISASAGLRNHAPENGVLVMMKGDFADIRDASPADNFEVVSELKTKWKVTEVTATTATLEQIMIIDRFTDTEVDDSFIDVGEGSERKSVRGGWGPAERKHKGPGPHPSGSEQAVHGQRGKRGGVSGKKNKDNPDIIDLDNSKGISRADMPQIPTEHQEGFEKHLKDMGVKIKVETVDASQLYPAQKHISRERTDRAIAGLRAKIPKLLNKQQYVSSDGYILDGHHRWAAMAEEGMEIPIKRIDMEIDELLAVSAEFNESKGIIAQGIGKTPKELQGTYGVDYVNAPELKEWDDLLKAASTVMDDSEDSYQAVLNKGKGLVSDLGGTVVTFEESMEVKEGPAVVFGPIKSFKRAKEKVTNKYGGDWNRLSDVVRASVISKPSEVDTVKDLLYTNAVERGWSVVEVDDKMVKPTPVQYRDVAFKLMSPEGLVAELQVVTPKMWKAKNTVGHKLYEEWRTINERKGERSDDELLKMETLYKQQSDLYSKAWEEDNK